MENGSVLQPLNGNTTLPEFESLLDALGVHVSSRIKSEDHFEVMLTCNGKAAVWGRGPSWWAAFDDGISQMQGAADIC